MLSAILSLFGVFRKIASLLVRMLASQVSVPAAVIVLPALMLAFMWWRADHRAGKLAKRLEMAQSDLATAHSNIDELRAGLSSCNEGVSAYMAAADEANRRAEEAARRADAAERDARRTADSIMMTQLPASSGDGPSIEECRAVDALLRQYLLEHTRSEE